MHRTRRIIVSLSLASLTGGLLLAAGCPITPTGGTRFDQTNLTSNGTQPAAFIDTNLVNPWGLAQPPDGPFWIANTATGIATTYNSIGQPVPVDTPLGVIIPSATTDGIATPTGVVINALSASGDFFGNTHIFATTEGTLAAWLPDDGDFASLVVDNSSPDIGSAYTGLALMPTNDGTFLLAADFRNRRIDVFDSDFMNTSRQSTFADGTLPAGFVPFNVQVLNDKVYVTYARQDANGLDDVPGVGNGYINEFDTNGVFVRRIASAGPLNSPWGLAIGPSSWGEFAGTLIVGNFGDGKINAFSLGTTPAFIATLADASGNDLVVPGLRALLPGSGTQGTDTQKLYFTATGINPDSGLFGSLERVP